jgi:hypothetical protein
MCIYLFTLVLIIRGGIGQSVFWLGHKLDNPGFYLRQRQRIVSSSKSPNQICGPPSVLSVDVLATSTSH